MDEADSDAESDDIGEFRSVDAMYLPESLGPDSGQSFEAESEEEAVAEPDIAADEVEDDDPMEEGDDDKGDVRAVIDTPLKAPIETGQGRNATKAARAAPGSAKAAKRSKRTPRDADDVEERPSKRSKSSPKGSTASRAKSGQRSKSAPRLAGDGQAKGTSKAKAKGKAKSTTHSKSAVPKDSAARPAKRSRSVARGAAVEPTVGADAGTLPPAKRSRSTAPRRKQYTDLVAVDGEGPAALDVAAPRSSGSRCWRRVRSKAEGDSAQALVSQPASSAALAPMSSAITPGSEDEQWIRNHPLYKKLMRGYPLPISEQEILALKAYTPKEYGGDAELRYF